MAPTRGNRFDPCTHAAQVVLRVPCKTCRIILLACLCCSGPVLAEPAASTSPSSQPANTDITAPPAADGSRAGSSSRLPSVDLRRLTAHGVVRRTAADGRTILVDIPSGETPAPGARIVVLDRLDPVAGAISNMRHEHFLAGRVDWFNPAAADLIHASRWIDADAVALFADAGQRARERLVARGPLWTRVTRLGDSGDTAWLGGGPRQGVMAGDTWLIERDGWPVARLDVTDVDRDAALASVEPLVANARPAVGDWVRLWPSPREARHGDVTSRVLRVLPRGSQEQEAWIPYPQPRFARPLDRWTISRNGQHVAIGVVREINERFVVVVVNSTLGRAAVEAGDLAVRRPADDIMSGRAPVQVFRAERDYALLNAGELDGLASGMTLVLTQAGRPTGRLKVETVHEHHCGASLDAAAFPATTVAAWDEAFVDAPRPPASAWGFVERVSPQAQTVLLRREGTAAELTSGRLVSVRSARQDCGLIVLAASEGRALAAALAGDLPPWITAGDAVFVDGPPVSDRAPDITEPSAPPQHDLAGDPSAGANSDPNP